MSEELTKFITEVPLKVHGAVGVGVGGTAGTGLMLDLLNTWLATVGLFLAIVVSLLSVVGLVYKIRQERTRSVRDQLELEMFRKQLQGVAQKD